jgi:hypothetical protein
VVWQGSAGDRGPYADLTGYTSITAFNPRFSGFYGSVADQPLTILVRAHLGGFSRYTARWIASGLSPTPSGRRNFMKNGSRLKRIFNELGTFFDPVS